jgi:hypothetical protein
VPLDTWQCVDARPVTCLDLRFICRGTRSVGYRQRASIRGEESEIANGTAAKVREEEDEERGLPVS